MRRNWNVLTLSKQSQCYLLLHSTVTICCTREERNRLEAASHDRYARTVVRGVVS